MTNTQTAASNMDLTKVKPYGDTFNDGMIQMSFTLPLPDVPETWEAGRVLAMKMGLEEPSVVHHADLGIDYTYLILFGKCKHTVDYTGIKVTKVDVDSMDRLGCEKYIEENIKRPVVIVGATTGTDAHTVGIDAIMNMKGFDGHFGLERYKGINALNMGAQIPNEELIAKAIEMKADAILVSQIVTQKDVHVMNLSNMVELCEAEGIRDKILLLCGGPRVSHELAQELGFDAGFGPGTYAEDVASYVLTEVVKRNRI